VVEPTSTMLEADNEVTHEAGKATGDDHESGITTVDGTVTTDDLGNETTVEVTIVTTTIDGTDDGNDDHSTTTVFEPTSMTDEADNEVTHEAGTATNEDHESGTTTVDGTVTTDDLGNETTVDEINETITNVGTDDGTDDH